MKYIWVLFMFLFLKDTYALIHMFLVPDIQYLQNIEVIVELAIIGVIYFFSFEKPRSRKLLVVFTIICFVVAASSYSSSTVSSTSLSVFRLYSAVVSLSYFNKILTDMRVMVITSHSLFWFTSGLLIYSTGTFFIMLFSGYIFDMGQVDNDKFNFYWNINNVLSILMALFASVGLWLGKYDQENFAQDH